MLEELKQLLDSLEESSTKKKFIDFLEIDTVTTVNNITKIRLLIDDAFLNKKTYCTKEIESAFSKKGIDVFVTIVVKKRDKKMIKELIPQDTFKKFKKIMAIHSAKGGVGKSTLASHCAIQLSRLGYKVALLDLDVYGPSIPRILRIQDGINIKNNKFIPKQEHGLEIMSIAFLLSKIDVPMIWRAPIVNGVIQQLFLDTEWTESDLLIIDVPPGTGDIPILLAQSIPIDGMLLVSTQDPIALDDLFKGLVMFEQFHIPILGLVYNMSTIFCKHCQTSELLFAQTDEFEQYFTKYQLEILANLPFDFSQDTIFSQVEKDCPWGQEFIKLLDSLKNMLCL